MKIEDLLDYNPDTGELIWKVNRGRMARVGKVAGTASMTGHRQVIVMNKRLKAHRIAWYLHHGEWPDGQIDHINGIRDDNRIENLRVTDARGNCMNRCVRKGNVSGILGVNYRPNENKYCAHITYKGKTFHLGYFNDKFEAARARALANLHFGFHPNHGRSA
jgi:hypothetical protein